MANLIPTKHIVKGREAWLTNLSLTFMIFEKVRSSLGPRGGYKMITYNKGPEQVVKISRDIIPTLEELGIQYPAISFIGEAAKMQREECGEGVTQFTMLVSALIMEAEKLQNQGIHPNKIIEGYMKAARKSIEIIEEMSYEINKDSFGAVLKSIDCERGLLPQELSEATLEAFKITRMNPSHDLDRVRFIKKIGGKGSESKLVHGIILKGEKSHPGMPDTVEDPKIAILSGGLAPRLETKMKGEGPTEIELTITDPNLVSRFREAEMEKKRAQVSQLKELGVSVLLSGQPLDESVKGLMMKQGIFAVDSVKKEDLEEVARATGAEVASRLSDLFKDSLGSAEKLYTEDLASEKVINITGCSGASFLLRGSTENHLTELEATIKNALKALKVMDENPRVVSGGGAAEIEVSRKLSDYALSFTGKEQLAVQKFANAVEEIPRNLAINNGLDEVETMMKLRSSHEAGKMAMGIGLKRCSENVCLDIFRVKKSLFIRATEVASMMLRIDTLMISNEIAKFHKK